MQTMLFPFFFGGGIGLLFTKRRIPGGMLIGSVLGAMLCGILLKTSSLPPPIKTLAQIVAGSYIGSSISQREIRYLPTVFKPFCIVITGLFIINVLAAFTITRISRIDLLTALFAATPGGISDIPMIAADFDTDPSAILALQIARFFMAIGFFPLLIRRITHSKGSKSTQSTQSRQNSAPLRRAWPPLLFAAAFGLIGKSLGIPAGTMSFATVGSILSKQLFPKSVIPTPLRKFAQCLSGTYVGASIGLQALIRMQELLLPIAALLLMYCFGCFLLSKVLLWLKLFDKTESMLAVTPAGASDIALIAADFGVQNISLVIIQILRLVTVITLFPILLAAIHQIFQ